MVDPNTVVSRGFSEDRGYLANTAYFDISIPKDQVGGVTTYGWVVGRILQFLGFAERISVLNKNKVAYLYVNTASLNRWIEKHGDLVRNIADHPVEKKINAICTKLILQKAIDVRPLSKPIEPHIKNDKQNLLFPLSQALGFTMGLMGIPYERTEEEDKFVRAYQYPAFLEDLRQSAENMTEEQAANVGAKYPGIFEALTRSIMEAQRILQRDDVSRAALLNDENFLSLKLLIEDVYPLMHNLLHSAFLFNSKPKFEMEPEQANPNVGFLRSIDEITTNISDESDVVKGEITHIRTMISAEPMDKAAIKRRLDDVAKSVRGDLAKAYINQLAFSISIEEPMIESIDDRLRKLHDQDATLGLLITDYSTFIATDPKEKAHSD